jgi:hypothetical protein
MPGGDAEKRLTCEQEAKAKSLIEAMEARMRQAETFAWAVPGLALTSQALLFTVAFGRDTSDASRAAAAISATAILLAALHFLGKHSFNFDLYEAVIDAEREKLGLGRVSKRYLLKMRESLPEDSNLRLREWKGRETGRKTKGRRSRLWLWLYRRWAFWIRNPLVVHLKAFTLWALVLGVLAVIDVVVFVDALRDWLS